MKTLFQNGLSAGALSAVAIVQIVCTTALTTPGQAQELVIPQPTEEIVFGVYDPPGTLSDDNGVSIEHVFLPWADVDLESLLLADRYALDRNRSVLLTVEPWTWDGNWRLTPIELRNRILNGDYDQNIQAICTVVAAMESPVTIRWAQEMENESGRFSWANWRPEDYVEAYRRVVDSCREVASETLFMWSPLGEDDLQQYYPGDNYVDTIGLSVFGLQEYDNDKFGRDRSFEDILRPGYDRVLPYGKPIYVAELGYVGDRDYVERWAGDVTNVHDLFPELVGVIYFNDKEVWPWPERYGYPDWRFSEQILRSDS